MQIRYTVTPQDVGALLRYKLRHSPRFWAGLVGIALIPVALNTLLAVGAGRQVTRADVGVGLLLGTLAALTLPVTMRMRTKRDERTLSIEPAGIRTSVGRLSGEVPWARIGAVAVTPEYIFITGKSGNAFTLPSRAFATPEERNECLRRIAEYRQSASGRAAI